MKAIWTKYLGPTNYRGSRVKAEAECGPNGKTHNVTVCYDDGLNSANAHDRAALELCRKMGWHGDLTRGGRPDGVGYVYTFLSERERVVNPVPSYAEQDRARKEAAHA